MARLKLDQLSRRERQIMDLLYRLGEATVSEVREQLDDAPGYSSVRAQLRILEEKGWLDHRENGPRYVYLPRVSRESLRGPALGSLLRSFFAGSRTSLVAALYDSDEQVSPEELDRLEDLVKRLKQEGR